jgi:hypothetical protein
MIYCQRSVVPVADLVQPLVQKKTLAQALDSSWQQPAAIPKGYTTHFHFFGGALPLDPTGALPLDLATAGRAVL